MHPEELALRMQSASSHLWGSSLREAFLAADRDRNGTIDRQELEVLLRRQNLDRFPAETAALLDRIDKNGDGTLDYAEFLQVLQVAEQQNQRFSEAQVRSSMLWCCFLRSVVVCVTCKTLAACCHNAGWIPSACQKFLRA